ncbi:36.4 kDa proline-rich protein-like [Zingiber officinale]|uniref:36.4 kDa proline-rich protein-like n=1 Tax=Zingiber officinale TaxID=94328 RepID=UPI001C4B4A3E|nr:36.4 kDa proline-rich protein-like [Zingiber officinale]
MATESPEIPTGFEPVDQGQTQDTVGVSGSQTPMTPLDVPTSAAPAVPTPTVFTVPPGVLPAYLALAPVEPTAYQAPPPPGLAVYPAPAAPVPPVPTVYPTSAPVVSVAPFPVPPPTVPLAATTHIDSAVPPAVYAPVYAATPGVHPRYIQWYYL